MPLILYRGVFALYTHHRSFVRAPDVARPRWFVPSFTTRPRDARARPPAPPRSAGACTPGGHAGARGRTEGPAASTLLLLLVQLVEYLLVPRVELSILLIAAAGPLGQRGCAESRHPRLRLIISEIGGCIIDLPPDTEEIERSLRKYASLQGDQDGKSTRRHGMNNSAIMAKGGKGGAVVRVAVVRVAVVRVEEATTQTFRAGQRIRQAEEEGTTLRRSNARCE